MKPIRTCLAVCVAVGACTASAAIGAEPDRPVAVKTDHLPSNVARRVQDAAAKGHDALRRYVTASRAVFAIDLQSLAVPEHEEALLAAKAAEVPAKVARDERRKTP